MGNLMQLNELRKEIDNIDDQILALFLKRMEVAKRVAEEKQLSKAVIANPEREREILVRIAEQAGEDMAVYTKMLYSTLFELSRSYQGRVLNDNLSGLDKKITEAIQSSPEDLPKTATVACQGIAGAYSQQACDKLFPLANISYFKSFEGVISAVDSGMCRYGILPVENNIHGSVGRIYDLLSGGRVYIVAGAKLQIRHALMAKPGVRLEDIKEAYSHEQAFGQCSEFTKKYNQVVSLNTAIAAKEVSESERCDIAAICSPECAKLYGLEIIKDDIQNSDNNHTRFICISKNLEIYPGANKLSLMLSTEHKPGALFSVMAKFSALGINITKLESRPIPGRDFEFMFYFDMEASVRAKEVRALLSELSDAPETFVFLGNYLER